MDLHLSEGATTELVAVLSANLSMDTCGGSVRLIAAALPGNAVCAARTVDDVVYLVIDFDKPMARRHAVEMVRYLGHADVAPNRAGLLELVPAPAPAPAAASLTGAL